MRTHTREKPYECSQCNKAFTNNGNLSVHMRTQLERGHINVTTVIRLSHGNISLQLMRTHTGEKPYHCSLCEKAFAMKSRIKMHMWAHTREEQYQCSQPDKPCTQITELTIHISTHISKKPYQCSWCDKIFRQKAHFITHKKTH